MTKAPDMTVGMSARELVEEELIHGALRREQLWRMIGLGGAGFGVFGCLAAAAVAEERRYMDFTLPSLAP